MGLDNRKTLVSQMQQKFPACHSIHAGYGAHPASYLVSSEGWFIGGKAATVWLQALPPCLITHVDNFTFTASYLKYVCHE
jgi:hypothetical protein